MNAQEYLKGKKIGEPTYEGVRLVDSGMKDYRIVDLLEGYHKAKVENLSLANVSKRSELLRFMAFAIDLPEIPEHSTKELVVDKYLKQ